MGKKIFVSYKYGDTDVAKLPDTYQTKVRDYVDKFEEEFDNSEDIYKGEEDGEDLSELSDDTIWEKLKTRIYDSSITVIFISPNMKEANKSDRNQWIPWEVSYSLKEVSRKNKNGDDVTSHTNAMLAVLLPDSNNSYEYYLQTNNCCLDHCSTHKTAILFDIIKNNMFNKKNGTKRVCRNGSTVWTGESSYIEVVKWCNFINNYQYYIDLAVERSDNIDDYDIKKEI